MASTTVSDTVARTVDMPTSAATNKRPTRPNSGTMLLYAVLVGYGVFSLAPFVFAVVSSFKTYQEIFATPPSLIPHPATLQNYQQIFGGTNLFPHYIFNSLVYGIGAAGFNVLLASMAGYAFGRMEFWGKNFLFAVMLGAMMIPGTLIMIPKFLIASGLGLTDNYFALIVPNMVSAGSVFLMTQFLKTLPKELEESAMIDGASRLRIFWQVILPLARPAMTTVALFSFQGAWNDFLWPLLVMSHQQNYTLTVGLTFFKGDNFTFYNLLLAGAAINILPLVVLFFFFQRYFVRGMATAGLAGR